MVFYNVYNFITSFWGGNNSDLENQKLRNEPIRIVELTADQLQEKIKNLRSVDTELARKIREDIEINSLRNDHIRTEEETQNNKPISEMEMNKVRNATIKVFDCKSCDLRTHISKLKSIATYEDGNEYNSEDIEELKPQTILDEIQIIQEIGLSGWFESRKK